VGILKGMDGGVGGGGGVSGHNGLLEERKGQE